MEITLEKKNDCEATLNAVATAEEVQALRKKMLASYGRSARVAGFRPGKAPTSVLLKHYGKDIEESVKEQLADEAQREMFKEHRDLKMLNFPDIEVKEAEGGAYEVHGNLMLLPSFELPEYEGIEVTEKNTEVSDEEVQEALQKFAEVSATREPVERAATAEDTVVMDFKTSVEGKPTAEFCGKPVGFMEGREDYRLSLTDTYVPELCAGLVGAVSGDHRDITAKLPDNFPIAELKGKEMQFACEVKQVLEKRVPEITAELFEEVMPGKSLDDVRAATRESIKVAKEHMNETSKADQITDKLADQLSFPLPERLVEREVENVVQRKVYAAIQAGNFEASKNPDSFRDEARTEAVRALRVYFALQEIADKENISVSDYELMAEVTRMAQSEGERNVKAYIRKLQKQRRITGIRLGLLTSKVMELLAKKAKVTAADGSSEA